MHTPGHAVLNVAVLGSFLPQPHAAPILAGALLPDLPILALYARERWLRGTPEDEIWAVHYQRPFWRNLIHGAHSVPLAAAGLAASAWVGSIAGWCFFASLLLHCACDLPTHALDAHRHFLPLSQWRFVSPFSYWDERYHGRSVALLEALLVLAAAAALWSRALPAGLRAALPLVVAWYGWRYWRTFLRRRAPAHASSSSS